MHDNALIFHTAAFLVQCSTETRVRLTESHAEGPEGRRRLRKFSFVLYLSTPCRRLDS